MPFSQWQITPKEGFPQDLRKTPFRWETPPRKQNVPSRVFLTIKAVSSDSEKNRALVGSWPEETVCSLRGISHRNGVVLRMTVNRGAGPKFYNERLCL